MTAVASFTNSFASSTLGVAMSSWDRRPARPRHRKGRPQGAIQKAADEMVNPRVYTWSIRKTLKSRSDQQEERTIRVLDGGDNTETVVEFGTRNGKGYQSVGAQSRQLDVMQLAANGGRHHICQLTILSLPFLPHLRCSFVWLLFSSSYPGALFEAIGSLFASPVDATGVRQLPGDGRLIGRKR
ncbi:hypothetical protein ANO11243_018180 [Dothideomycetidae sp. 11243]|nr:hypothetical protein ANO11243_018180 [fungal sp. No.11243]